MAGALRLQQVLVDRSLSRPAYGLVPLLPSADARVGIGDFLPQPVSQPLAELSLLEANRFAEFSEFSARQREPMKRETRMEVLSLVISILGLALTAISLTRPRKWDDGDAGKPAVPHPESMERTAEMQALPLSLAILCLIGGIVALASTRRACPQSPPR
ncbi:hypothetical protein BBF93_04740 [Hyphomonas sp. CACIAM 19H1]|nr:hypothetical protein BBF93_04740 [Hyphomonas sp. CACIAM 19H1]